MNSALMQHCPKCRKAITTTMLACPNCGFSLDKNHLTQFRQPNNGTIVIYKTKKSIEKAIG
ncbi:hypothetical protein ACLSZY_07805 [Avibacterium volantium]|uniref:hypothetical protein n=1 Tax=Avibacterium TaxID=292486 RepID=UPI0039FB9227